MIHSDRTITIQFTKKIGRSATMILFSYVVTIIQFTKKIGRSATALVGGVWIYPIQFTKKIGRSATDTMKLLTTH